MNYFHSYSHISITKLFNWWSCNKKLLPISLQLKATGCISCPHNFFPPLQMSYRQFRSLSPPKPPKSITSLLPERWLEKCWPSTSKRLPLLDNCLNKTTICHTCLVKKLFTLNTTTSTTGRSLFRMKIYGCLIHATYLWFLRKSNSCWMLLRPWSRKNMEDRTLQWRYRASSSWKKCRNYSASSGMQLFLLTSTRKILTYLPLSLKSCQSLRSFSSKKSKDSLNSH